MIFRSPFPDVEVPDVALHEYLFADIDEVADQPAMIDATTGLELTYAQLVDGMNRVATALAEAGVHKGDVIALCCPNSPYYALVFHGILRAGAVATTVNSLYTPAEIAEQLRDSRARLVVTVSAFAERVDAGALASGLSTDEVILLDPPPGRRGLAELLATPPAPPMIDFDPDGDLAVLPYSAGTTGRAKGVLLTHRNLVANLRQCQPIFALGDEDTRFIAVLPYFHIYGMQVLMNLPLAERRLAVTLPRFDLAEFLGAISRYRTQRVHIAPPVAVALAKHPMVDQFDLSCVSVVFSGAAPLDAELAAAVARRLDTLVIQGYGMTEMSPVSHAIPVNRPDIPVGTVGPSAPNMECRIIDPETGQDVEPGAPGELLCRGPNVMKGYLNDPDATAATLDEDGFLHTGDIAVRDADGNYTIVDRVKELIKYKGYQVAPAELEALLLTHPRIADVAVIGVRDADGEEIPKAFVVGRPETELTAAEVIAFVADRIAPHKKIRAVEFIDTIPKSSAGKILRKDLRARESHSS